MRQPFAGVWRPAFRKAWTPFTEVPNTWLKRVAEATGGKFQIQVFAGGEIVPGPAVFDAVKDNTVEMGHTVSYYFFGKDPTYAFDCAIPFGMN
jgi:TRAP-type mannitol/chloroaromatic compound transport system substrate-binding protein